MADPARDGVVARRQAMQAGLTENDLARLRRQRQLVPLHRGVYVNHTGPPTWVQQGWAAVLLCWPSALAGHSALRVVEGPGSRRPPHPVEVVVQRNRSLAVPSGIVLRRTEHLEERVQWHLGPPRMRYDEAALDVAARAPSDFSALGELSRAVQGRRTTAGRLLETLARRERIARRRWMASVLQDVADGACSVLEHGYLTRVERAHGLAPARRQVRDADLDRDLLAATFAPCDRLCVCPHAPGACGPAHNAERLIQLGLGAPGRA